MSPQGAARTISFETEQGTLMSVDASADGRFLVFDLLGHVYRMAATGGRALCLTQNSGVALNYHPRFSPDGSQVAFISDRAGQSNVWIMNADGTQPRALFLDLEHRYASPIWSADGRSIFVTRLAATPGQGWHRRSASIWELPLRGRPKPLLESATDQFYVSSAGDGGALYLYSSRMVAQGASIYEADFRLRKFDLRSNALESVPTQVEQAAMPAQPERTGQRLSYDSGGVPQQQAEIAPQVSPNGRYVAFARSQAASPGTSGNRYRYSTALMVLDTRSGEVRSVLPEITKDVTNGIAHYSDSFLPAFSWSPDSRDIVISVDGGFVRVAIDDLRVRKIAFKASVHREISEMTRRQATLDADDAVPVRFIQWPTANRAGQRLVFAALGRLWLMDLSERKPRPLTADSSDDIQITPSWSADGRKIAFASWSERGRGYVWIVDAGSGEMRRVTTQPGEYIWPSWTPKGDLVVVQGPGNADSRDAWNEHSGWKVVRLLDDGSTAALAEVGTPWQPLQVGGSGRIYFTAQWDGQSARHINLPYPSATDLELGGWNVMSIDADGRAPRVHARFPAGPSAENVPVVSEEGGWLAYQADYRIIAMPVDLRAAAIETIRPEPGKVAQDKRRADENGGAYSRWRDGRTLEFAAGNQYVTFDVSSGERRAVTVPLTFTRERNPTALALTNARIITMDSDRIIGNGTIVVRDGRIQCVGRCKTDRSMRIVDLSGKTVLPGLIDVHEHIADEPGGIISRYRPRSMLPIAYGVTTVVDPAVASTTLFPLAEMIDAGRALGPRTFGAAEGVFGTTGGPEGTPNRVYGDLVELRDPADAEYQVARRAAWGAVTIKNYRLTSRQQQQWLIAAARRHRLSVTAEGHSLLADLSMVMDGQTGWEHFLPTLSLYDDVIQFVGQAHATYSPTLSVAGFPDGSMFYYRPRARLDRDPKYSRFASASLLEAVKPREGAIPSLQEFAFPALATGVAAIIRAGGYGAIGEHGENPGIGSHWEIWTYATAMKPLEALRMATLSGARFVGLERELGSVEVGKFADLLVLNSDPLVDITRTADIAYVMKGGYLYDPDTLSKHFNEH